MKSNKLFMAFAAGKESTEGASIKFYTGVGPVFVKGVNPNKAELEKFYNRTLETAPEYISETEVGPEGNRKKVPQVRIDFLVNTDAEKCNGIDIKTKISFFIAKEYQYNRDRTKVQVINDYGEFTWIPVENAKAGTVPETLKWFDPKGMRPAFIGEEPLTGFIKAYLGIPNKSYRNSTTGEVVEIKNLADAEAKLDKIPDYFKGDFSELRSLIALQPKNKVKCLFGVRSSDEGKQYQAVYTHMFLKNNVTKYEYLEKHVNDRKANGAYSTTEFIVGPLKEYTVEATDFSSSANDDLPFGDESDAPWGL